MKLVLLQHKVYCTHCHTWSSSQEGVKLFELNEAGGKFLRDAKPSELANTSLPRESLIVTREVNRCTSCWREVPFIMPARPAAPKTEKPKVSLEDMGI